MLFCKNLHLSEIVISVPTRHWLENSKKLAPCGTNSRLFLQAKFFQVQSHITQKLGQPEQI